MRGNDVVFWVGEKLRTDFPAIIL